MVLKVRPMTSGIGKRGFSLLELLLVIIILGIVFSLATPIFKNTFSQLQLNNFTEDLVFLIRYLHTRSVAQQEILCLNFNCEEGKILPILKDESGFQELKDRFAKIYFVPKNISIETDSLQVCFYPDGTTDKLNLFIKDKNKNIFKIETITTLGDAKVSKVN